MIQLLEGEVPDYPNTEEVLASEKHNFLARLGCFLETGVVSKEGWARPVRRLWVSKTQWREATQVEISLFTSIALGMTAKVSK